EPERARDRNRGAPRQLGIGRRLLGSHLEDASRRKRDGADRLAQEARASASGLDQRDLQVRAKTREHDSRETSPAADVDDEPRLGARPKIPDRAPRSSAEEAGHGTRRNARAVFRAVPRPGSDGDRPRGNESESWVTLLARISHQSPTASAKGAVSGRTRPSLL